MSEVKSVGYLEQAITAWLFHQGLSDVRWIREKVPCGDFELCACMRVDVSSLSNYFWEAGGLEQVNSISELFGYYAEFRDSYEIGFYGLPTGEDGSNM